jgi:hypothetical protein
VRFLRTLLWPLAPLLCFPPSTANETLRLPSPQSASAAAPAKAAKAVVAKAPVKAAKKHKYVIDLSIAEKDKLLKTSDFVRAGERGERERAGEEKRWPQRRAVASA